MATKPIVVVAPKAERATLRNCGVLPVGCLRTFGAEHAGGKDASDHSGPVIYLWEHEIDYRRGADLAARISDCPADIPVFFGMAESKDDDERQANEVAITRLLGCVVVHVVFLDNRLDAGRGYAEFRSFAEIADWSRHYSQVLNIRFPNENELRNTENVLVIVARGEQVKVSCEELAAFNDCIGRLKAFKSCYFLDYNLSMDGSSELFHARAVWDVMVGRLLLGFLLSQESAGESNSSETVWLKNSGVKIWRAAECVAEAPPDFIKKQVSAALAMADKRVQSMMTAPDQDPLENGLLTEFKIDDVKPGGREDGDTPSGGWSDFPAEEYVGYIANSSRWVEALKTIKQSVSEWKKKHSDLVSGGDGQIRKIFQSVHGEAGQVFALTKQISAALSQDRDAAKACSLDTLEEGWNAVVDAERNRCSLVEQAQSEAKELRRAQSHYVGIGFGLVVVASVSALCGWVLSQLIAGLGGSRLYSIWLASATALGAFGAFFLVMYLHWRAGGKGLEAFIATCRRADNAMQLRHNEAKALVENAINARALRRRLNMRFRAWTLLERIKSVIITEIQPATAWVDLREMEAFVGDLPGSLEDRRKTFVGLSRKSIGSLSSPNVNDEKYTKEVDVWWGKDRKENDGDNFCALWGNLCKLDKVNAGHLPVGVFIPNIREFVSRFNARILSLFLADLIEENQQTVKEKISEWVSKDILNSSIRQFVSGSIDGLHDRELKQLPAMIFVQNNEKALDMSELESAVERKGPHTYRLIPSDRLGSAGQLGFMYQEFSVEFDRDEATGHLVFKEVSDA